MTTRRSIQDRHGDVVDALLTAHQRVALRRRFPGLTIDVRSVSDIRFRLDACQVVVVRPPFSTWAVGRPCLIGGGRYASAEASEIHALHAMLLGIVGRPLRD